MWADLRGDTGAFLAVCGFAKGDMNIIVLLGWPVTVDAFAAAKIRMMRFDQEGLHPDELSFA